MRRSWWVLVCLLPAACGPRAGPAPAPSAAVTARSASSAEVLFHVGFEDAQPGTVPESIMVLNGEFAVGEHAGERVLVLPGTPLETFGALFGPTSPPGATVSGRVLATAQGRRRPVFGLGILGVTGYQLRVAPAGGSLEILRDDQPLAAVPFVWTSGLWTHLRLQAVPLSDGRSVRVQGMAWTAGQPEPLSWMVTHDDPEPPPPGRCALWAAPYSGTPILFDDLAIRRGP